MKRVTKNNILKYIQLKKEYEETKDDKLLIKINIYTEEVINKDRRYFSKISSYDLPEEDLKYLL